MQIVEQCSICGVSMNQPMAHAIAKRQFGDEDLPEFDETLKLRYYDQLVESLDAKREAEKSAFDAEYAKYLRGDKWADKRRLVMARCQGICEGCRSDSATEVHHLTYEHVQNEFLWELVGLCKACHDRVHEDRSAR